MAFRFRVNYKSDCAKVSFKHLLGTNYTHGLFAKNVYISFKGRPLYSRHKNKEMHLHSSESAQLKGLEKENDSRSGG